MTKAKQREALYTELSKVVKRFSEEFDLDLMETVSALEMVQLAICYQSGFFAPPEDYSDYF